MISEEILLSTTYYEQPYQKEKDYLQELVLSEIYASVDDSLIFKGGTALSKFYGSPRFSDDLDFTLVRKSDKAAVTTKERLDAVTSEDSFEYPVRVMRRLTNERMLSYELSIGGPLLSLLGKYQHLKVEVNMKDTAMLPTDTFRRDPKYPDVKPYISVVMSRKEILAEKINALLFRHNPKARDLFDLYFLVKNDTEVDAGFIHKKLGAKGEKFTKEAYTRRLSKISSAWKKELERLIPKESWIEFDEAKTSVSKSLRLAGML